MAKMHPLFALILILVGASARAQLNSGRDGLYLASTEETRWVSPENPTGAKGAGGKSNKGAKGNAFIVVKPGATAVMADVKGSGVIRRIWISGTLPRNPVQSRAVRLEMYWDGAKKPAVDCPVGDFFGFGLGVAKPFESALFASPEARSFVSTVPMPYRKSAKVQLVNESPSYLLVWYDMDLTVGTKHGADMLYFHAAWRREPKTSLGEDFAILPRVVGNGRYLGAHIGVIGNPAYRGTWFGEGEVKVYLDGDKKLPSLVGTGTEDYIGSGWGQGEFRGRQSGSLVSDSKNDLYSFYRYHLDDPVYFHKDCRVTIQQIGNTSTENLRAIMAKGGEAKPVWVFDIHGEDVMDIRHYDPTIVRILDDKGLPAFTDPKHPQGGVNFYRRDDVCATVYFYLDKPSSNLPRLSDVGSRLAEMQEKVWGVVSKK